MKKTRFLFATLIMMLSSCGDGSSQKTYTVTWKNWDGSTLEVDRNVKEGSYPSYDGYTPIRSGDSQYYYSFSGWSPSLRTVSSDITYTAQFSRNTQKYTVTWKNWNGNVLETDRDVPYGSTPTYNGSTPTRDSDGQYNYTFSGWSPAISSVTKNATYTAQFEKTENYECDNVYHWKNNTGKISHDYQITERKDSAGLTTFECSICHHVVKENATVYVEFNGSKPCVRTFYNYAEGSKDFIVPPTLFINGASIPTTDFRMYDSYSGYTSTNPFSQYLKEVENIWLPPTFTEGSFYNLTKLKQINIESTSYYGELTYQFRGCSLLEQITIPSTFNKNLSGTFYGCNSLKKIILNNNPERIGSYSFIGCNALEEFMIPTSVSTIDWIVFGRDDSKESKLKKIYIPSSVITIGYSLAVNCPNLTIYCEAASKPAGWNENWNSAGSPVVWNYSM